jgi:hypothetical protein
MKSSTTLVELWRHRPTQKSKMLVYVPGGKVNVKNFEHFLISLINKCRAAGILLAVSGFATFSLSTSSFLVCQNVSAKFSLCLEPSSIG